MVQQEEDELGYPEKGDLVIATVNRIVSYGVYVSLDEYHGKEGLIHVSEIATTWVRNIKDHLRIGQKLVLKVLRVDPNRNQIDLSRRRVTGREKIEKMLDWKRERKAESILKSVADQLGKKVNIGKVREAILSKYSSLYEALEGAVEVGEKAFQGLDLTKDCVTTLTEFAKAKIKLEEAKVTGIIELTCFESNGIHAIKEALIKAMHIKKPRRATVNAYVTGAPKYTLEVIAGNYPQAENLLNESIDTALSTIESYNGLGKRIR